MATDDNPNKVTKKGKDVFSPPPPKDIKTAEYVSNFLVTIGLLGTLVTFFMHESFTTKSEFTIRCCYFFALYVIGASPLMYLFPGGERYKNKRKKEEREAMEKTIEKKLKIPNIRELHKKIFRRLQSDPTNPDYRSLFHSISQLRIAEEEFALREKLNLWDKRLPTGTKAMLQGQMVYTQASFRSQWEIYAGAVVSAKSTIHPNENWKIEDILKAFSEITGKKITKSKDKVDIKSTNYNQKNKVEDRISKLKDLSEMFKAGLLTQEEFDKEKKRLLGD